MNECSLCKHERITHHYFEDERVWIANCAVHGTPMWVLKRHVSQPAPEEVEYGRQKCRELFGENIRFRGPQTIRDHYHEHIVF